MKNLIELIALEMMMIDTLLSNGVTIEIEVEETPAPPTKREVITEWLEDLGLTEHTDYEPNEEMITMSLSELEVIKQEMDYLRVRAEEGEELAQRLDALHSEFFPSQE